MEIELQWYEAMSAGSVGFRRQFHALSRADRPAFAERYPGQLWYNHIAGACAEMAVAKALGIYWGAGVDTFDSSDMQGTDYEVRFSPTGKPKIRPRDTRIVIGVVGSAPSITKFRILGWMRADDGKRDEWRSEDAPICYFPPANAWQPISLLMRMRKVRSQIEGQQP